MVIYTLFVLSGQAAATLFGRLYYERGGKSIWMATIAQFIGFPLLFPFYCISPPKNPTTISIHSEQQSSIILALAYISFGIFLAADSMMYSVGILYLPVSTFSLICAPQLVFNTIFSFFFHSQRFTPFIINYLVLLAITSSLVIFQANYSNSIKISKENYAVRFICTFGASAGYGLMLSLTQLSFKKVLKRETYMMVLEIIIYQSLVATCAALVGLFTSGEWKGIKREMQEFELGQLSYVMTLVEIAIASKIFTISAVGLIFEVFSLFSNVVSVLGMPIVSILAVIFSHDKMNGIKTIAMVLVMWGFVSYIYQYYLDNLKSESEKTNVCEISKLSRLEEDG
ncbi:hypothetical protein LWI29_032360 [Acer saccharum]|uniref:Probable purine permease n=1 Tax=Acer saccharum TaxID=4024 RepID=A0AA39RJE6_ACESA|nr:hypothetical protein LWI29_032360 [Acer saccharum]